jgi:hypothetical protein
VTNVLVITQVTCWPALTVTEPLAEQPPPIVVSKRPVWPGRATSPI